LVRKPYTIFMEPTDSRILPGLEGNDPIQLTAMQEFVLPHIPEIQFFCWVLWSSAMFFVLCKYVFGIEPLTVLRQVFSLKR
jgi:hypothetical protein